MIALSWNAPQVRLYKYFKDLPEGQPVVVAVGAMAKGPDTFADEYTDEKIGKIMKYLEVRNRQSDMMCRYFKFCIISFCCMW